MNTASRKMLEPLPGIGPKTVAAIIAARPIKDLADLDRVPGIEAKMIDGMRELVAL